MIGSGDGPTFEDRRDVIAAVVVAANKVALRHEAWGVRLYSPDVHSALEELRVAVAEMNSCLIASAVADFVEEKKQ